MPDVNDVKATVETLSGFAADLPHEAKLRWEVVGDQLFYDLEIDGDMYADRPQTEWPSGVFLRDELFIQIQSDLMEDLGRMWPACPAQGSHPLIPTESEWVCPAGEFGATDNTSLRWDYGSLHNYDVPAAPERRDGELRWLDVVSGWGVIAHEDGDVWFHATSVRGANFERLHEATPMSFRLRKAHGGQPAMQGRFRSAEAVWPHNTRK